MTSHDAPKVSHVSLERRQHLRKNIVSTAAKPNDI
jgi:hypothetical protein